MSKGKQIFLPTTPLLEDSSVCTHAMRVLIVANQDVSETLVALDVAWEDKQAVARNDGAVSRSILETGFKLAENDLVVSNEGLKSLGFEPIKLNVGLVNDVHFIANMYSHNLKSENILTSPNW